MARPKSPEGRMSPVTIAIPAKLKKEARHAANEAHMSLSAFMAALLRDHLQLNGRAK